MPRLPVVSGEETVRTLCRAGFVFSRQSGSHVVLFHAESARSVSVPVHSGRDLPRGTLRKILRTAGLTAAQFRDLLR